MRFLFFFFFNEEKVTRICNVFQRTEISFSFFKIIIDLFCNTILSNIHRLIWINYSSAFFLVMLQFLPAGAPLVPLPLRCRRHTQPWQTTWIKSQSKLLLTKAMKDWVIYKDTWWVPFLLRAWEGRSQEVVPTYTPIPSYYPKVTSCTVKAGSASAYPKDSIFIDFFRWMN